MNYYQQSEFGLECSISLDLLSDIPPTLQSHVIDNTFTSVKLPERVGLHDIEEAITIRQNRAEISQLKCTSLEKAPR